MSGRLVVESARVALSQYVSRIVLLARGLAAAAALGPAGFGAWNALVLILDYGSYASLGALYGLDLALPAAVAAGDEARAARLSRAAWGLSLAGSAAFSAAVIVYLGAGSWLALTGWGWGAPLLMLACAFLQVAIHYHASALRARGDFTAVSAAHALQALVGGGIGLLAVWRAGVWGLLWGWFFGGVAAIVRLRLSAGRPPLGPAAPREGVALARMGFALFAYFLLTMVLRSLDRIALVRFGGNEPLGRYSIGLIAAGLVLYLPEAAATVLFPRLAAAADGARDLVRTRAEVVRAQRALTALLPLPVGLAALWAGPILGAVLPAFAGSVPALRVLAVAALLLTAATLPGYTLLGLRQGMRALPWAAAAVLVAAMVVISVAAWRPTAVAVALASTFGQGVFSVTVLVLGARALVAEAEVGRFVTWSLVPALWAAALLALVCSAGGEGVLAALLRSLLYTAGFLPLAVTLARGLGLRSLARGWLIPEQ